MLRAFSRRAAGALLRPTRDIARLRAFASARVAREGEGEGDATDQQPAAADAMRGEDDEAEEPEDPSVDKTAPVLEFLAAVKVGKAADALVPEHVPDMDALLRVDGITLKKAGLTVKERKRALTKVRHKLNRNTPRTPEVEARMEALRAEEARLKEEEEDATARALGAFFAFDTFFTHPVVSTFDRVPFRLTDE